MANQFTHPWTEEDIARLNSDYPCKGALELSLKMDRSYFSIVSKATKLGIRYKPKVSSIPIQSVKELIESGFTMEDISRKLNIPKTSLWRHCRKNGFNPREYYVKLYAPRSSEGRKARIKKELDDKCAICGFERALDIAHIVPAANNGPLDSWNCLQLCPNHHRLFDNNALTEDEFSKIEKKVKEAKVKFKILSEAQRGQKD